MSELEGDRKSRLSWIMEYRRVGGFVEGMYVKLGRGEGCWR
jgi:hypothetical protein